MSAVRIATTATQFLIWAPIAGAAYAVRKPKRNTHGPVALSFLAGAGLMLLFRGIDWVADLATRGEDRDETETWERFGSGEWR